MLICSHGKKSPSSVNYSGNRSIGTIGSFRINPQPHDLSIPHRFNVPLRRKSGYEIAPQLETDVHTVYKWRKRFVEQRVDGLKDRYRSGQPVKLTEKQVKTILDLTVHSIPAEATAWSIRLMAKAAGVTYYQVLKVWPAAGLKPHLIETFKLSKDRLFSEKVINIIGLYMNPPDNAFVLSVDEKTQIQALDRT